MKLHDTVSTITLFNSQIAQWAYSFRIGRCRGG